MQKISYRWFTEQFRRSDLEQSSRRCRGGRHPGHILTVQSNQFYAVQKAECAVQVAKLCSPKYVLWTFTQINNKSYSLICCICSGDGREPAANSACLQRLIQFPGIQAQRKPVTHLSISIVFGSEANARLPLPRSAKANAAPVVDCLLLHICKIF